MIEAGGVGEFEMSRIGSMVGRIRLVERLGSGGVGEVFVGYDETLARRVAVKSIHAKHRLDDQIRARFLQEARILSRLDHPHICEIFDYIEGEDRDYLVLELIDGSDLKKAIRQGLGPRQKLRIAAQIADVLVVAHQENIVHRDLKPDNVMVATDGEVKVLDFGLAHSHNADTDVTLDLSPSQASSDSVSQVKTSLGVVMGTPRYMSPEQARGESVTPASDMFSFGLLLQQLFTEKAPYEKNKNTAVLLAEVSEGRTREVVGLPREITELISDLQSLAPGARPTAKEAARRLRHLRDLPGLRLRRAVVGTVLALAVFGSIKYTFDLRRERTAALEARDQAEGLITFMLEDLSEALNPIGQLDVLEDVARTALTYYEEAAVEEASSDSEAIFQRGLAFYRVGQVLDSQGDLEAALAATKTAQELHRSLHQARPEELRWTNGLAHDELQLASIYHQRGESDRAIEIFDQADRLARSLVAAEPDNDEWQATLGEVNYQTGMLHVFAQPTKSEPHFREAIGIFTRLADRQTDTGASRYRLAVLYGQGLGYMHLYGGRDDESLRAVETAIELYEGLVAEQPSNNKWQFGYSWDLRRLGSHLQRRGDIEAAEEAFGKALEISRRLVELEPTRVAWMRSRSVDHGALGGILEHRGDVQGALASHLEALEINRRLFDLDQTSVHNAFSVAIDLHEVGRMQSELGFSEEARNSWESGVELLEPLVSRAPEQRDIEHADVLASLLLHLERPTEAQPLIRLLESEGWFESPQSEGLRELAASAGLLIE